jgi:Zn-dependent protease
VKGNIPLGRYAGIPIRAHWSVLILITFAAFQLAVGFLPRTTTASGSARWVTAGIFAVLFAGTLLAHELAHAALARRFGIRVEAITLWAFGGATGLGNNPFTPGQAAAVAGAGPAVSGGLGIVSIILAKIIGRDLLAGLPAYALVWLAVVNLFLVMLNLLPGAPLDGGRLLQAWLWHRSGDWTRATVTTGKIGRAVGGTLTGLGAGLAVATSDLGDALWLLILGVFLTAAATEQMRSAKPVPEVRVGQVMTANPVIAPSGSTVEEFIRHLVANGIPYRQFPVWDDRGAPLGVVDRGDLFDVDPNMRTAVRIRDIAHPVDVQFLARPEESLAALLRRTPLRPAQDTVLVIDEHGRIGTLTATDVARTAR